MPATDDLLHGLAVFERGWLSSNNVLVHAAEGEAGACLIDSSHVNHAAQTEALLRQTLAGRPLVSIVNTHLHSDHCGGNASLQRAFGAAVHIPPGQAAEVQAWNDEALSYRATGQCMEPFRHQAVLSPDRSWRAGGRQWEVIAAPGHDPHMVMLFDRAHGVLVSADALWENGFGLVFPEIEGEPGFDDLGATLELIAALPVRVVIPGHGRPFADVPEALARARRRLQGFRTDPARHAWHGLKVLLKYHLMEQGREALPELRAWAAATPLLQSLWQRQAPRGVPDVSSWVDLAVADLVVKQVLAREGDVVVDV
jgi:glyoxylase-like metal-dependent hydrolase (beta-lactamase superfamily II)